MTERFSYIPSRIRNATEGGYICGTEDIIDDEKGKNQAQINKDINNELVLHQNEINALSNLINETRNLLEQGIPSSSQTQQLDNLLLEQQQEIRDLQVSLLQYQQIIDTLRTNSIKHVFLTPVQYESLESYDQDTLYFIVENSGNSHFGDAFPLTLG